MLAVWHDCNTVVHIREPQTFAERILRAALAQGVDGISFHAGFPTYDKGRGSVRPYHWTESIYQKPEKHTQQKEYRFALVGNYSMTDVEIELFLGPCDDLESVVRRK